MVDVVEACLDVGVEHPDPTLVGHLSDGFEGLVRRSLRAEPETHWVEIGFEDRLKDDLRCRHDHPIGNRGNAEWPGLARLARLWDVDPPQRSGPIGTGSKFCDEAIEEGPHRLSTPGFYVGDGYAVDAGSALVGGHVDPCPPHHITAGELVEEGVKATCSVLLGAAIKHALKGSNGVQAVGLSDGSSRVLGTHQRSSQHCRAPMKQGPFARDRLCCPARHHYYDPLRLPLGCRPFPGVTGYRQARSRSPQIRGRVGPLQFPRHPSDRSTPPTPEGPSPPAPRSQMASMAFAKSIQARHPLAPPKAGSLDDAAGFASCYGPASCSASLRPRPLDRTRRLHYRGPWRLPGPDSHRLADENLRSATS